MGWNPVKSASKGVKKATKTVSKAAKSASKAVNSGVEISKVLGVDKVVGKTFEAGALLQSTGALDVAKAVPGIGTVASAVDYGIKAKKIADKVQKASSSGSKSSKGKKGSTMVSSPRPGKSPANVDQSASSQIPVYIPSPASVEWREGYVQRTELLIRK